MCILTNLQFRCFSVPFCASRKGSRKSDNVASVVVRQNEKFLYCRTHSSGSIDVKIVWSFSLSAFPPFQNPPPHFGVDLKDLNANVLLLSSRKLKWNTAGGEDGDEALRAEAKNNRKAEAESTNSSPSHFQFSWIARRASILIRFDPCVGAKTAPAAAPWIAKQRQLKMKTQGWVGAMDLMGFAELNGKNAEWVFEWMCVCVWVCKSYL